MTASIAIADKATEELKNALSDPNVTEATLQTVLEQYSELVPDTDALGHRIQWNSLLSKFVLPSGKEVDLAYVTKSTAHWRIVLIELERPSKQLFIEAPYPDFHSATRGAIAQVNVWKGDAETDLDGIRKRLRPLMHLGGHWDTNPVEVCYVLVTGRNESGRFSDAQSRLITQLHREQRIRLLTWDSLLRMRAVEPKGRRNILVQKDGHSSFKRGQADTSIFAQFHPDEVDLPPAQEKWFRTEGYDIDSWRDGELLTGNHKHTAATTAAMIEEALAAALKPDLPPTEEPAKEG